MDVVERSAGEAGDKAETAAVAAAELVKRMTLEEKIGQMVLCGFTGTEPSADIERLIRDEAVGGVILFARNVQSTEQVARLNRSLQAAASIAGRLPLWISIDQEGGMVARITDGVA
ncbi:glycoside hydrolase family 3 N-terminal domain-containing protein, partial [Paenibacillus validus]|uniref:glycoside hydrolase family 3 N-terminal domain-containing protein n=3 Tax=Paenibacillus TaxID=44249 RepID=UPI002E1DDF6A